MHLIESDSFLVQFDSVPYGSGCDAECDEEVDCDDKCVGDVWYYNGDCDLEGDCTCSYDDTNCADMNYYDEWEYFCEGNSLKKKRLYHSFICDDVDGCVKMSDMLHAYENISREATKIEVECLSEIDVMDIDEKLKKEKNIMKKIAKIDHYSNCEKCMKLIARNNTIKHMVKEISRKIIHEEEEYKNKSTYETERAVADKCSDVLKFEIKLREQDFNKTEETFDPTGREALFYFGKDDEDSTDMDGLLEDKLSTIVFSTYLIIKNTIDKLTEDFSKKELEDHFENIVEELLNIGVEKQLLQKIIDEIKKHIL